jgi:UrcA family protein
MLKMSLIAVALLGAAAVPAFAQQDADVLQRAVSYADLDLTSPAGVAAFDRRIDAAVTQVCGRADLRDMAAWSERKQCRAKARSQIQPVRDAALASAKAKTTDKSVVLAAK